MRTSQLKIEALHQELDEQYRKTISKAVDVILNDLQLKNEILTEAKAELTKRLISQINSQVRVDFNPMIQAFRVEYSINEGDF